MQKKDIEIFQDQIREFDDMLSSILNISSIKKIRKDEFIELNAKFIYLLALFERFIGHLNQYCIKTKRPIKKKYIELFEGICDEKGKKLKQNSNEWKDWKAYYNQPRKMVNDYSILEKEKNGLVILRAISSDKINFSEKLLKEKLKFYSEARLRRNLIAHRGRGPDKIYYDELKKNNIDSELHKKILGRGLYSRSTKRSDTNFVPTKVDHKKKTVRIKVEALENNAENLVDLSITPSYLSRICEDIIMIKESFLMDLQDKKIDRDFHDLIKQGVVEKNKLLLIKCRNLLLRKVDLYFDKDITKLPIIHKVNYLLIKDYLINYKVMKKPKSYFDTSYKIIDTIKDEEHELATYVKLLLKDFINKDKNSFHKNTKKMLLQNKRLKKPYRNTHLKNWLIFHKYKRYKDFNKLFN